MTHPPPPSSSLRFPPAQGAALLQARIQAALVLLKHGGLFSQDEFHVWWFSTEKVLRLAFGENAAEVTGVEQAGRPAGTLLLDAEGLGQTRREELRAKVANLQSLRRQLQAEADEDLFRGDES